MNTPDPHRQVPLWFIFSQILSVSALLVIWLGVVFWALDSILATFAQVWDWVTQVEPLETFVYYHDSSGFGRMAFILWMLVVGMGLYAMGVIDYVRGNTRWKLWMGVLSGVSVFVHLRVFFAVMGASL